MSERSSNEERESLIQNEHTPNKSSDQEHFTSDDESHETCAFLPVSPNDSIKSEIAMGSNGPTYDESDQAPIVQNDETQKNYSATTRSDRSGSLVQTIESSKTLSRAHIPNATTSAQSMMHLMKGMIGTGILAIPNAFKLAGLWTGFFGILFIGVIATHCMHQLVGAAHTLMERTGKLELTYGKAVELAFETGPHATRRFSKAGYAIINVFLCITQFGFCIVYILFIAENISQVIFGLSGFHMNTKIYMTLVTLVLIPMCFIKNLKGLAPLSVMANVLTVVGLCITLFYCVQDLPPVTTYPAFNSWQTLPLYFGTAIYAFEGIGVVLPIENKMKYPEDFTGMCGVMNVSMITTMCLYAGVGFFGYLKAGDAVAGSITLNLPHTVFYSMVKLCFALAIGLTYMLQFYVPFGIIWPKLARKIPNENHKFYGEYVCRAVMVIGTFAIAAIVPHLDLMISLIGALASSAIALIIPPIIDILVSYPDGWGRYNWKVAKNIFIVMFGLLGFVAGTLSALKKIIQTF